MNDARIGETAGRAFPESVSGNDARDTEDLMSYQVKKENAIEQAVVFARESPPENKREDNQRERMRPDEEIA